MAEEIAIGAIPESFYTSDPMKPTLRTAAIVIVLALVPCAQGCGLVNIMALNSKSTGNVFGIEPTRKYHYAQPTEPYATSVPADRPQ